MFEDEARFGRLSRPIRCWAPAGGRAEVPTHRVREYTHVFGSVCPQDGELISLILPHADTSAMSLYLAKVAGRHPREHILMFMDRAGWHQARLWSCQPISPWTGCRLTARKAIPRSWSGAKCAASRLAITTSIP